MSCGCKTSGDSGHSCGTKSSEGCEIVDTCTNSYKLSVFDWLSEINNPSNSKSDFVEVRFKNERKAFYKNVNQLPLQIGSIVTVESSPGHDVGVVSLKGELVKIQMKKKKASTESALKVYRLATQKDIDIWQDVRKRENDVKIEARKLARNLNLEMKISDIEFQGDGSKITFYYTAEGRVDFRQLIKDFAATFRAKVDMKQIGFRQEAAKVGGIGSCGRELCCSTWLTDFRSVNTNAARYQQLSINPQKLAGQCGKLKCCLNYELDSYLDVLNQFPSSSTTLQTEKGKAFCIKIDVFKKKMWFAYVENSVSWYDLDIDIVKKLIQQNKKGEKTSPLEDYITKEYQVKTVDLIQENSVDRFEKKKKGNNRPQNKDRQRRNPEAKNNQPSSEQKNKIVSDKQNKPNNPSEGGPKNTNKKKPSFNKNKPNHKKREDQKGNNNE